MSTQVGIDFGTSNSTVGFLTECGPKLIGLEAEKPTIPSAIFFDTEEHQTLFGRAAIAAYTDHCEGRLLRALKSILGSSLIDDVTIVGNKRLSFKSIIGTFIGHLKTTAERQLGHRIESAVMGRPVWFVDDDPKADLLAQQQLEQAAKAQGFKHIEFQFEPIAAALDYEQGVQREELALIADIGGGTSDFSVVRVSPERRGKADRKSDILANTGVHIGGTDLDRRLSMGQVMPAFGLNSVQSARPELILPSIYYFDLATWHRIAYLYNNKTMTELRHVLYSAARRDLVERLVKIVKDHNGHRLAGDVEVAKITLSDHDEAQLRLNYIEAGLDLTVQRSLFETAIAPDAEKIALTIRDCLKQAGVEASNIDTLFLTGGTTAIPAVFAACKAEVPNARIVEGDKLGSVGIGLAIDAATRLR